MVPVLTLTRATDTADFADYLALKSDAAAIAWSGFATAPDRARLQKYYEGLIASDRKVYYLRRDGKVVGYCQFSTDGDMANIDGYSILGSCMGRGWGKRILAMAMKTMIAEGYYSGFCAWVSEHNHASLKSFAANGFEIVPGEEEWRELPALGRCDRFVKLVRQ